MVDYLTVCWTCGEIKFFFLFIFRCFCAICVLSNSKEKIDSLPLSSAFSWKFSYKSILIHTHSVLYLAPILIDKRNKKKREKSDSISNRVNLKFLHIRIIFFFLWKKPKGGLPIFIVKTITSCRSLHKKISHFNKYFRCPKKRVVVWTWVKLLNGIAKKMSLWLVAPDSLENV